MSTYGALYEKVLLDCLAGISGQGTDDARVESSFPRSDIGMTPAGLLIS
jgi:hypothetical protein